MRFEVLVVIVKITVLWNMMPFSLVERYQHFEGKTCHLYRVNKLFTEKHSYFVPDHTSSHPRR